MIDPIYQQLFLEYLNNLQEFFGLFWNLFIIAFTGEGVDRSTQISLLIMVSLITINVLHYGGDAIVRTNSRKAEKG